MQNLHQVQTKNELKLEMYIGFLYIHTMQKLGKMYLNANWNIYAAADVCFLYLEKPFIFHF